MSDVVTAAAAGAVTGAAGGFATGLPAPATIICGVVGAVVSVWVAHGETFELSGKWFSRVTGLTALYFLVGLFGARGLLTAGAEYASLAGTQGFLGAVVKSLTLVPEWVLCGGLALGAAYLLPLVGARLRSTIGGEKQ